MVSWNTKFRCFLVPTLIQKYNSDNKVLETSFIQRNKKKDGRIKCCKFWYNSRDLSERASRKQNSLNLSMGGVVEQFKLSFKLIESSV